MKLKVNRSIGWNLEYATMNVTQIITDGAGCYPWTKHFAWWPVKTITGSRAWGVKLYKRRVWVVWGQHFHMEPETQYATLFEILADDHNNRMA
jgi:hypothetical protein